MPKGHPIVCNIGERFRKLVVVSLHEATTFGNYYLCKCDCGNEIILTGGQLHSRKGSCGCRNKPHRVTKEYKKIRTVWACMMRRCYDERHQNYVRYGGCGITVDERWHKWLSFYDDVKDTYKEGLQLDRTDNSKGYSKDNFRWVDRKTNMRNRKNMRFTLNDIDYIRSSNKNTVELGKEFGVDPSNISRIKNHKIWA